MSSVCLLAPNPGDATSCHSDNTIQYNIRLLEAVRTQRRTIIEREKYVENEM